VLSQAKPLLEDKTCDNTQLQKKMSSPFFVELPCELEEKQMMTTPSETKVHVGCEGRDDEALEQRCVEDNTCSVKFEDENENEYEVEDLNCEDFDEVIMVGENEDVEDNLMSGVIKEGNDFDTTYKNEVNEDTVMNDDDEDTSTIKDDDDITKCEDEDAAKGDNVHDTITSNEDKVKDNNVDDTPVTDKERNAGKLHIINRTNEEMSNKEETNNIIKNLVEGAKSDINSDSNSEKVSHLLHQGSSKRTNNDDVLFGLLQSALLIDGDTSCWDLRDDNDKQNNSNSVQLKTGCEEDFIAIDNELMMLLPAAQQHSSENESASPVESTPSIVATDGDLRKLLRSLLNGMTTDDVSLNRVDVSVALLSFDASDVEMMAYGRLYIPT
jgi:hypothetical protein